MFDIDQYILNTFTRYITNYNGTNFYERVTYAKSILCQLVGILGYVVDPPVIKFNVSLHLHTGSVWS